jgi:ferredoxin-thioredoxin reductase catalytic subunit
MMSCRQEGLRPFLAQVSAMVTRYARRSPYVLNPHPDVVEGVLMGLARNRLRYGRFYCPCREVTGDPAEDRINICPCRTHRQDIAQGGSCECGLFMSPEFAARQVR